MMLRNRNPITPACLRAWSRSAAPSRRDSESRSHGGSRFLVLCCVAVPFVSLAIRSSLDLTSPHHWPVKTFGAVEQSTARSSEERSHYNLDAPSDTRRKSPPQHPLKPWLRRLRDASLCPSRRPRGSRPPAMWSSPRFSASLRRVLPLRSAWLGPDSTELIAPRALCVRISAHARTGQRATARAPALPPPRGLSASSALPTTTLTPNAPPFWTPVHRTSTTRPQRIARSPSGARCDPMGNVSPILTPCRPAPRADARRDSPLTRRPKHVL
ncbi:unnamed protein product, partial [Closterium sp. NIES-54]